MNILKNQKSGRSAAPRVIECLNLHAAVGSDGDVLTPVGVPRVVADEVWQPLATVGDALLVHDGLRVGCLSGGEVTEIATLPALPLCVHTAQLHIIIMTEAGQYLLQRDADGTLSDLGMMPRFDGIALTAEYLETYSSTISACSVDNITSAVCSAYREIVDSARLAGAFVQPVLARCRLLDYAGNVVHVTPPVALMLNNGAPLVSAWQFGSDDSGATVRAQTVSAEAYQLRLTVGNTIDDKWRKIVHTLEVQVTPQFHPIDFSGKATVSLGRASSTDNFVRVTLPGVERGLSSTRAIASAELLKRAVERFDSLAVTVAHINDPFGGVDKTIAVAAPVDVADEADDLAAALSASAPVQVSQSLARLLMPNSFTADGVADSGDAVVWANVTPQRFGGYDVMAYAATFVSKKYSGYTAIDFANGDRVVTAISGESAPTTLCPLICYPSAEAVSLTIAIQISGESTMRKLSVALTPDATGRCAVYVSPTLAPIAMTEVDVHAAPAAVSANHAMTGYVAASSDAVVPQVSAVSSVGGNVLAVLAARSGSSAWEYRRARFYAFCSDGLRLVTVNSALTECAVNLLDRRSIANRHCAVDGGNVVYALSGGEVLQVSANSVKSLAHNVDGDRLAWIATDNEIVVANTDDNEATHFCLDFGADSYSSTLVARGAWLAAEGRAYAVAESGLVDLADRTVAAETAVRWTAWHATNARRLVSSVRWMLKASQFKGNLSVDRMWLTAVGPTPLHISRLSVNGAIKSPIKATLHGHRSVDLQVDVQANVSSDFALTNVEFISLK